VGQPSHPCIASARRIEDEIGGDTLIGGIGIDALSGSSGNDIFVFDVAVAFTNVDAIASFGNVAGNDDTIRLDDLVFTGFPAGVLYFDSDGSGAQAQFQFATLTTAATFTNADFVII
jgi:Ca2+-binding RTX toxin-like protein